MKPYEEIIEVGQSALTNKGIAKITYIAKERIKPYLVKYKNGETEMLSRNEIKKASYVEGELYEKSKTDSSKSAR